MSASTSDGPCRTYSWTGTMPRNPAVTVPERPFSVATRLAIKVGVSTSSRPSRRTSSRTRRPAESRTSRWNPSYRVTGTPSKETISSPGRSPACAAGVGGSPGRHPLAACAAGTTHLATAETVVVGSLTPKPMSAIPSSTNARKKFINGPAKEISAFCHHFLA